MSALTITHTHAEGTLIDGTSRGDGSAEVLKAQRWRWSRNLGSWYIPQSRDRRAKLPQINATATALRAAGFTVELDIDDHSNDLDDGPFCDCFFRCCCHYYSPVIISLLRRRR